MSKKLVFLTLQKSDELTSVKKTFFKFCNFLLQIYSFKKPFFIDFFG